MKIVTVNVPESYLDVIEKLVGNDGLYPSRSELIRCAVRDFLLKELKLSKNFKKYQQDKDIDLPDHENYVRIPVSPPKETTLTDLENLVFFNNIVYDDIMRVFVYYRTYLTPSEIAKELNESIGSIKKRLETLHSKYSNLIQIKNHSYNKAYKLDIYFLKEFLKQNGKKKTFKSLCSALERLEKKGINPEQPTQEFKTYKIIRRLEY